MSPPAFSRRKFIRRGAFAAIGFPAVISLMSAARAVENEPRKLGFALLGLGGLSTGQLAPALQNVLARLNDIYELTLTRLALELG